MMTIANGVPCWCCLASGWWSWWCSPPAWACLRPLTVLRFTQKVTPRLVMVPKAVARFEDMSTYSDEALLSSRYLELKVGLFWVVP